MFTDKTTGVSNNAMNGAHSEPQQPSALAGQEPYCFFKVGTPIDEIEQKLSILMGSNESSSSASDLDRLHLFRLLKSNAAEQQGDKFQLILVSDRTQGSQGSWRYEFRIGENHAYRSEARVIGEGADLIQYENEYFRQAFLARDEKRVTQTLDFFRQDPGKGPITVMHLGHFLNLIKLAPQSNESRFEKHLDFDRTKQTWTYGFSIDGVSLFQSQVMDATFMARQISAFQRCISLDRFLEILKPANSAPEASSYLAKLTKLELDVENDSLGVDADQAKMFELMASVATIYKKKSAIELGGKEFTLTLDGKTLFQGEIPEGKEGRFLTPRVQITMSALRVALFPLQRAFAEIMKNFDKYRLGAQGVAAQSKLTLIEALKGNPEGLREIKLKPTVSAIGNTSSYDLKAVFNSGEKPIFSVIENSAISRVLSTFLSKSSADSGASVPLALKNKQGVLKALCASMAERIYAKSVSRMTNPEKAVLHWQMHKTPFGDSTLGEILDVPKPDAAPAFDNSGKLVQDF